MEIVPHRWDLLDTGEFSIVMGGKPGEVTFKEVHRLPVAQSMTPARQRDQVAADGAAPER